MSKLVPPHGSPDLKPLLLEGQAKTEEIKKAQSLKNTTVRLKFREAILTH